MAHVEDRWYQTVTGPDGKKQQIPRPRCKQGKRWRVRYADAGGKERARSFAKKDAADQFRSTVEADVLRGTYIDPNAGKITLRAYAWQWAATRVWDASTREIVEARLSLHIIPGLGHHRLDWLARHPSAVSGWLAGLRLAPVYSAHLFSTLSSVLGAAVDDGLILRNPCRVPSVRPPRQVRRKLVPWTSAQVNAVRAAVPARWQAMVAAGAWAGLRQGELFGLPVDAVDFLRHRARVRLQVRIVRGEAVFAPPKGKQERDVPLPGEATAALAAHLARFGARSVTLPWLEPGAKLRTETLVFTGGAGGVLRRSQFNAAVWRPARKKAGIPAGRENGMHALRHYYAAVLLAGGVDIETLSAYLGHHDPGFTLRVYGHLRPGAPDRARRAVEQAIRAAAETDAGLAGASGSA